MEWIFFQYHCKRIRNVTYFILNNNHTTPILNNIYKFHGNSKCLQDLELSQKVHGRQTNRSDITFSTMLKVVKK